MNPNKEAEDLMEVSESGRYGCPLCPSRFSSTGDKKRHMRSDHPGRREGSP